MNDPVIRCWVLDGCHGSDQGLPMLRFSLSGGLVRGNCEESWRRLVVVESGLCGCRTGVRRWRDNRVRLNAFGTDTESAAQSGAGMVRHPSVAGVRFAK